MCTWKFSSPLCRRGKKWIVSLASAVFQLPLIQIIVKQQNWGSICSHCLVTFGQAGICLQTSWILHLETATLHEGHNCHLYHLLTVTGEEMKGEECFYLMLLCGQVPWTAGAPNPCLALVLRPSWSEVLTGLSSGCRKPGLPVPPCSKAPRTCLLCLGCDLEAALSAVWETAEWEGAVEHQPQQAPRGVCLWLRLSKSISASVLALEMKEQNWVTTGGVVKIRMRVSYLFFDMCVYVPL